MGNMVVKHLKFADDTCVFSPSVRGLQPLLNIFGDYAAELEIALIAKKKIGAVFYKIQTLGKKLWENMVVKHLMFADDTSLTYNFLTK